MTAPRCLLPLVPALLALALSGCVERTARVTTRPSGALVTINDEEVGVSPVKFNFLWYGDYDIIVRKPGFHTLKTHYRIDAPWYQWPPFDFIAEVLIPTTIRDQRELPPFELEPAEPMTTEEIVKRATDLRDQAVFEDR
ncbi:MAG: PEGA domain-containing protein [Planctomycetota bacterium]